MRKQPGKQKEGPSEMIMRGKLRLAAVAAIGLAASVALESRPASAQLFWDWSGDETIGGSGRRVISFNPQYSAGQIIVSFGDRKLYYITRPGEAISYPIAVPREKSRWEGVTNVSQKRENPSWTPTPTMIAENPRLPRWVPGGHPMNPLGVRALYLGSSAYRIHGTDAPWTIGTAASKGCIRLYNQDVLDLYPRVNIGAKVTVTYQTFTTSGAPAVSSLSNALPTVPPPNFFMFGDSGPMIPPETMRRTPRRAKSKAVGKSAAAKGTKAAPTRAAAAPGKGAEKGESATPAAPVLVETAASRTSPPPRDGSAE
jgi:lipoprotein-anchoring transpeptidase ErfK/SrfK